MANVESAKKRIRQTEKKTLRNKHVRSTVRSSVKKVREAIKASDKKAAATLLVAATTEIDKAVSKGVYPRTTGSRYVSRLATQIAAL